MGLEKIKQVEDMPVYRVFYELALDVEKATHNCPPDFRWLRNQLLRSPESACANMTEGFYSQYSTEYLQSLYRPRREGRETVTHLNYAKDVNLLSMQTGDELATRYDAVLQSLTS